MYKRLVVYTAIVGEINDQLYPAWSPPNDTPVQFVCFSDREAGALMGWDVRPVYREQRTPRLTARWHKIMAHVLFPNASYSIWHDGSHHLIVNPWQLIESGLSSNLRVATFSHPRRDCVYQEIETCLAMAKDTPERLIKQRDKYKEDGYPEHNGLFETSCLVRAHTEDVARLNERWWCELEHGSCRDQVALPYVLWKERFSPIGVLAGKRVRSPYFNFRKHGQG